MRTEIADLPGAYTPIEFHECTAEDYEDFSPIVRKDEAVLELWKKRGMFCLDDLPPTMAIGGIKNGGDFHSLRLLFAPCNFKSEDMGASASEDCNWSLDE